MVRKFSVVFIVLVVLSLSVPSVMAAPSTFQSPVQPPDKPLCAANDFVCWMSVFRQAVEALTALVNGGASPAAMMASHEVAPIVEVAKPGVPDSCVADKGVGYVVTGTTTLLTASPECPAVFEWNRKDLKGRSVDWGVFSLEAGESLSVTYPVTTTKMWVEGTRYSLDNTWTPDGRFATAQANVQKGMYDSWVANGGSVSITVKVNYTFPYAAVVTSTQVVTDVNAFKAEDVVVTAAASEEVSGTMKASASMAVSEAATPETACHEDTRPFVAQRGSWRIGSPDENCVSIVVWTYTATSTMTTTVSSFMLPYGSFLFMPEGTQGLQVFYSATLTDVSMAQMDTASQYCAQLTDRPACTFEEDAFPAKSKLIVTKGQ